jgi:branched-chain amino acid transport system substrate-binding protein
MVRLDACRRLGAVFAASAAFGVGSPAVAQQVTEIVLGEPEAMTGAAAPIGRGMNAGIELATRRIAAEGGFDVAGKKYKFKVVVEDYASAPDQAVIATQKLLNQARARFILGPNLSLAFVPAAEILAREKVLVMSGATSIARYLGQPGKELFFKISPNEVPRAAGLVRAFNTAFPNVKSVAMLLPGDDVGRLFQGIYAKEFQNVGIKAVYNETFPTDTTDYAGQLTTIKQRAPDALFVGYLDKHVSTLVNQSLQLGVSKVFLNSPGPSADPGLPHQKTPGFGYVWTFQTRSLAESGDKRLDDFKAAYEKFMGRKPDQPNDYYSLHTHDTVMVLAAAMQKAGTVTDMKKIAQAVVGLKGTRHSALDMVYNEKHEATFPQSVGIIKDGEVSYTLGK